MNYYKQCLLVSDQKNQVSWIRENLAKVGNRISFKKETKDDTLWTVEKVYSIRLDEDTVMERKDDYRHQRKMSDI